MKKYQKAQSVKKVFAFKSVQNAFEKHSKTVRKTVRNYVTFYVKRRDFQDLKWHDFVFLQGKALQGVKKRSEALRGVKKRSVRIGKKTFQSRFFLENCQKPRFLKTDWKKTI
jgi:hypothetical protein